MTSTTGDGADAASPPSGQKLWKDLVLVDFNNQDSFLPFTNQTTREQLSVLDGVSVKIMIWKMMPHPQPNQKRPSKLEPKPGAKPDELLFVNFLEPRCVGTFIEGMRERQNKHNASGIVFGNIDVITSDKLAAAEKRFPGPEGIDNETRLNGKFAFFM